MRQLKVYILCIIICCIFGGCAKEDNNTYGVYLSVDYDRLPQNLNCQTLVIDAQYYTKEEIEKLHKQNVKIYTYINVGAIEDFREYYEDFQELFLKEYENWPEERFVDVSDERWKKFILDTLVPELQSKGIDGFFVDNLDVYYEYPTEEIYEGITDILTGMRDTELEIIVNGANVYITEYFNREKNLSKLIDGVNQESVFTSIHWEEGTFGESEEEERQYYLEYLEKIEGAGIKIFLLEYTKDMELENQIYKECEKLGYTVYVSNSIELDE